jgi:hypothetical protein
MHEGAKYLEAAPRGGIRDLTGAAEASAPLPGERLRAFALAELQAAAAELARPDEARHKGVHLARKHLRRTRATLALGRPHLGRASRRLDDDIGQLCRGLAPLRDAQALIEGLERLGQGAPQDLDAGLPEAIALARQRRDGLMERALSRDPDFQRRRDRLAALALRLGKLAWAEVDAPTAAAAIARSERRLLKARRRVERHPEDEERWHGLRRRLRRLRQQEHLLVQELPALYPGRTVPADEATRLGDAQDDALILRHCGRHTPFPPELRRTLRRVARERLREARAPAPPVMH